MNKSKSMKAKEARRPLPKSAGAKVLASSPVKGTGGSLLGGPSPDESCGFHPRPLGPFAGSADESCAIGTGRNARGCGPDEQSHCGTLRGWSGKDGDAPARLGSQASLPAFRPQVGCVITCHNYGRYLRECIESCLAQTVPFVAMVVVDDASTDETSVVVRDCIRRGEPGRGRPAMASVRVDRCNVGEARNAGYSRLLSMAPGTTHVIFVDADNTLVPETVGLLLPKLDDLRVGVAYGNLLCFGDRSGLNACIRPWSQGALQQYNIVDTCALVRREALDQMGGWDTHVTRMEDWLTWARMEANGWRFAFIPAVTARYRVHRGQKSRCTDRDPVAVRHAWRVGVITPFCGRWWSLDRYEEILRLLDWPRENLFVVAVDNSASKSFGAALRGLLEQAQIRHVVVPCSTRIDGTPAAQFSDDAAKRASQCYQFNLQVGRLWATGRQFLPAWATHVWTLEDDIEPPPDALGKLAWALWMNRRAVMASGFVRSRFDGGWMVFRHNQRVAPTSAVTEIDRSGFFCALWRRTAFDSAVLAPSHALSPFAKGYYDWMACDSARLEGGRMLGVGGAVCRHWKADGTFI